MLLIDGQEVEGSGPRVAVRNPASGEEITTVASATAEDVDRAVQAARRAFESGPWRTMDAVAREKILWRMAELIERDKEELAVLESLQNGKTAAEAGRGDIPPAFDVFYYYAGWARKIQGEVIPVEGPNLNYTMYEPMGVVGAIVAWNYPLLLACWKVAPALAAGNTVVLKPSVLTPLTALRLGQIGKEAGLPDGVLNVITGDGPTAGMALARHMEVDKIAFTGSTDVARELMKAAAESNLKRLSLELGGKSPQIVFPDADLDAAIEAAFKGIFANKGEICSAGSRILIHGDIYDTFVERLVARAGTLKLGDPLDAETGMGSQISQAQLDRIVRYVEGAKREGATLLCGGERDISGGNVRGFFFQPTIFGDVTERMEIAREEVFGPVLCCMKFRDEDEAVRIANATIYGLVSAVWTRDIARAHDMARRIKAGSVWINLWNGFDSASPFGGFKQSGFGREMGQHAIDNYTQVKSVWVSLKR
jgi:acyl-CoA reductase-like NAD-dependent aldehyde dehydrogenase